MHFTQVIAAFLTLLFSFGYINPSCDVKQQTNELSQLAFHKVKIPVYLPDFLPEVNDENREDIQYFFVSTVSDEAYSIEIYDLASLDSANVKMDVAYPPLSCKTGSIYGSYDHKFNIFPDLKDADEQHMESKELISDLYAQISEDGTSVRWEDTGWNFVYCGSSGRWSDLQQFAARWKEITPIMPQGTVCIYQKSIFFMWSDSNCHYCYEAYQTDLLSALSVFDSFQKIIAD